MQRETRLIAIGTWRGPAYLIDGAWYVRPQSIVESMGFEWKKTRAKLLAVYGDDIIALKRPAGISGKWKPLLMTVDAAMKWLGGLAHNNKMAAERRVVAKQAASAIARQFASMVLENGCAVASEEIVVLETGKAVRHG